jgi:four helix bundle protein
LKHGRFCDGFTEAAGSVCRNIREGFGRFTSASIVQFFDYAIASLEEVEDYLHESRTRKFIDADRFNRSLDLAEHTRATTLKFKRFHENRLPPTRPPRSATRRRGTK